MGDKKKKKENDKDKDKKKTIKKKDSKKNKKSRDSFSSDSSSSSSSSDSSSSSRSRDRSKVRDKKKSKNKTHKKAPKREQVAMPYDFGPNTASYSANIPGLKGPNMSNIPPPAPHAPAQVVIPKLKNKQVNIFKLLPKLNHGPLLFAKTLYSTQYIGEDVYRKILKEMCADLEKTARDEGHKKGMQFISKCAIDLERASNEKEYGSEAKTETLSVGEGNKYQMLQKAYLEMIAQK